MMIYKRVDVMNLRVEPISQNSKEIDKIKELFYKSFPKNERMPLWFLLKRAKMDFVDFIAIYDNNVFVGFTYLITNRNLTFVLYLAINDKIRSKGYGRRVLSQIKEKYPNNRIILNIEVVDETASNYEHRVKRKMFYIRNGYQNSNFIVKDHGGLYELMIYGSDVTKEEYYDLIKRFTGSMLFLFVKPKIILSKDL